MCYFVAMVAPCALQLTFCDIFCVVGYRRAGFELWRASVGKVVAVRGCCLGCMCVCVWGGGGEACACFMAAWWVVFASGLHCMVVPIEMMPGILGLSFLLVFRLIWPAGLLDL